MPVARCLDLYRFFRFSAFGATAVLPLLGAGSVRPQLGWGKTLGLLGVAASFHAFAYVHNDVCDLELDRGQPLRAAYPLVRGAIAPPAALGIALGAAGLAFAIDAWLTRERRPTTNDQLDRSASPSPPPRCARHPLSRMRERGMGGEGGPAANAQVPPNLVLASAFLLMAAYNRWGKRCPFPPLTDLTQAAGWAALIAYGAAAAGRPAGELTKALIGYELLLILMVNGVHGPLRDLANDREGGARTTAIMLGATASGGGLDVPPALIAYALALQAALLGLPIWAASENLAGYRAAHGTIAALGVSGLAGLSLALLALAARGGARPADVGMLHLILLLSAPLALVAPGLGWPLRTTTALAHGIPLLANGMTYDALRWLCR